MTLNIENRALDVAEDVVPKPLSLISATKQLLISSSEDLVTFLEKENSLLLEHIRSDDFRQCLETIQQTQE